MRITINPVLDMETLEWVSNSGTYDYCGPVILACGGASGDQNAILQNEINTSNQLNSDLGTYFGQNQTILKGLQSSAMPIVARGPSQFGLSAPEAAAMQSQAAEQIAQAGRSATDLTRSSLAAAGGGRSYLPSGSEATVEAGLAAQTAEQQARAQQQITQYGYNVGRQEYQQAAGEMASAPGALESPVTSMGGLAVGGEQAAMSGASAVQRANEAPMQAAAGLIGGLGAAALGRPGPSRK